MNVLVAVSIAPFGVGDELSGYVAEACKIIWKSGLKYKTSSMFTEIEGEWDDVMRVVKDATFALAERGIRTEVILKADIRPGFTNTIEGKIERLENAMSDTSMQESAMCGSKICLKKEDLLLYAITDRHWLKNDTLRNQVEKAILGGATMIQIREKDLDEAAFLAEAREIKAVCKKYSVPFIVNDNVALAKKIDADGVHVGQTDMRANDVRAVLGPNKILGVSTQTVEEAILAEKMGADYLGVGAVFPTGSKDDAWVLPHSLCQEICSAVKIPVVAIGGITKDNVLDLRGLGFAGISVISAIFGQNDISSATKFLRLQAEKLIEA